MDLDGVLFPATKHEAHDRHDGEDSSNEDEAHGGPDSHRELHCEL